MNKKVIKFIKVMSHYCNDEIKNNQGLHIDNISRIEGTMIVRGKWPIIYSLLLTTELYSELLSGFTDNLIKYIEKDEFEFSREFINILRKEVIDNYEGWIKDIDNKNSTTSKKLDKEKYPEGLRRLKIDLNNITKKMDETIDLLYS